MSFRVPLRAAVVLTMLGLPMVVRALDDSPAEVFFFPPSDGTKRKHAVDTAVDYPPPIEPPSPPVLSGGGLGGASSFFPGHVHLRGETCDWRCRTIMRVRRGETGLFEKPEGLDGYECDLDQARKLELAESKGIRVWDANSFGPEGLFIPSPGRVADALRGLRFTPKDRLDYFSWLWTTSLVVDGWSGKVLDVRRVPAGLRIRVDIRPDGTGSCVVAPVDYVETYLLHDDGRLEYLEGGGKPEFRGKCVVGFIV